MCRRSERDGHGEGETGIVNLYNTVAVAVEEDLQGADLQGSLLTVSLVAVAFRE